MSTRRSRIKAIANIPPRRKQPQEPVYLEVDGVKCEETNLILTPSVEITSKPEIVIKTEIIEEAEPVNVLNIDDAVVKIEIEDSSVQNDENIDCVPIKIEDDSFSENATEIDKVFDDANDLPPKLLPELPIELTKTTNNNNDNVELPKLSNETIIDNGNLPQSSNIVDSKDFDLVLLKSEAIKEEITEPEDIQPQINENEDIDLSEQNQEAEPLPASNISTRSRRKITQKHRYSSSDERVNTDDEPLVTKKSSSTKKKKDKVEKKKATPKKLVTERVAETIRNHKKWMKARKNYEQKLNEGKADKQNLSVMDFLFHEPSGSSRKSVFSIKKRSTKYNKLSKDVDTEGDTEDTSDDDEESDLIVPTPSMTAKQSKEELKETKSEKNKQKTESSESDKSDTDVTCGIIRPKKRRRRCKDWTPEETKKFYEALNTVGTDFTLMVALFPGRTRFDLKNKFKREDRTNRFDIDQALWPSELV